MKVEPNEEQKPAIYHTGGSLLNAGAGSGKTFVLTYHLSYLLNSWISEFFKENSSQSEIDFRSFIRTKLSKVVLMTFTKKAAGEISTRIIKRFKDEEKEFDLNYSFNPWSIIIDSFERIYIGTIHGFCFRMIKEGFIPGVSSNISIISETEFNKRIKEYFDNWLENKGHQYEEVYDLILNDSQKIVSSLSTIFKDPSLRASWADFDPSSLDKNFYDEYISLIMKSKRFDEIFKVYLDLNNIDPKYNEKGWLELLRAFEKIKSQDATTFSGIIYYIKFFRDFVPSSKVIKPRAKDIPEEIISYFVKVQEFFKFISSVSEDFLLLDEHFENSVIPWLLMLKDLFSYVDEVYTEDKLLTFSDLEYIVWSGLKDENVSSLVRENYSYFIVDEFQDTSMIQYEILQNLIAKDFNKLFCVGDIKQAIYGFRGGEIGVFTDCEKKVKKPLSMTSNFRSFGKIIHFNNIFFDFIFKLGLGFEGEDPHQVKVEHQTIPEGKEGLGDIKKIKINLEKINLGEEGTTLSSEVVNYIEALGILLRIKEIKKENPDEVIAILYQKLSPSDILINLLMQENISFTAQVKVPFLEDPIIGLFHALISYYYNESDKKEEFRLFLISSYLKLLHIDLPFDLEVICKRFEVNSKFFGMKEALQLFFFELGLSNSNTQKNLLELSILIDISFEKREEVFRNLLNNSKTKYSIDFQFGETPDSIQLMTAHASKGLEFDHVICGGIYTNGRAFPDAIEVGSLLGSFRFSLNTLKGKRYKTPALIYEDILRKEKDFSEAKRLFYVVGTRAIKTLSFVDISFSHYKTRLPKNSWFNGFRVFEEEIKPEILSIVSSYNKDKERDIGKLFDSEFLTKLELKTPLFHRNTLGIVQKSEKQAFVFLPELSITRLATIVESPFKFYLKNILKINNEEEEKRNFSSDESSFEDQDFKIKNSAERGTRIHEILSDIIISNFSIDYPKELKDVVENLKSFGENYIYYSEKEIKFELFHFMVSGIPDLYLLPKKEGYLPLLYDFKTGHSSEAKNLKYFFQLYSYAFALYQKGYIANESEIKLVIYYVDERREVERIIKLNEVENYLWGFWSVINRPDISSW